jgi:hypothetical protein
MNAAPGHIALQMMKDMDKLAMSELLQLIGAN